jgi:glutamate synthase domain-containing protein 3
MVDLEQVVLPADMAELHVLIEKHVAATGSRRGQNMLANWEAHLPRFVKVFPMEYRRVLGLMMREDEATAREEVPHG